jgi:hypothetical protein
MRTIKARTLRYWLSTAVTIMTFPGIKMPSPGWVLLNQSPPISRSPCRDEIPEGFYARYHSLSPPKSTAKKIKTETFDKTVWSNRILPESPAMIKMETDDDDFTPRCCQCTMESTFKVQQEHLGALSFGTQEWESLAAMLSPPPKILLSTRNHNLLPPNPLPPDTHNHFERPKNGFNGCLCICCVGPANAKPQVAACAVCGAQIPYSVCLASNRKSPISVPTMCFACMRAFV